MNSSVESLFPLVGSQGLAKVNFQIAAQSKAPFSTEVTIDGKEFNVVMQVLEFLDRQVSVRSSPVGPVESEYSERGCHLSFEIQQLHPHGSDAMSWSSAFVWLDKSGRLSIEFSVEVQVSSKAV
jgi:hypothetical protein